MNSITPVLIDYWQKLPAMSPAVRRQHLAAARDDVRNGCRSREALVPFALGDVDEDIVRVATAACLELSAAGTHDERRIAIEDGIEWIRRGLALNRGAVFSALLGIGDSSIDERLATQRLTLSVEEVATVCRQLPAQPGWTTVRFLRQWRELLEGSSDPALRRQHELISAALHGSSAEVGRLVAA